MRRKGSCTAFQNHNLHFDSYSYADCRKVTTFTSSPSTVSSQFKNAFTTRLNTISLRNVGKALNFTSHLIFYTFQLSTRLHPIYRGNFNSRLSTANQLQCAREGAEAEGRDIQKQVSGSKIWVKNGSKTYKCSTRTGEILRGWPFGMCSIDLSSLFDRVLP